MDGEINMETASDLKFKHILQIIYRRKRIFVFSVLVVITTVLLYNFFAPPIYESFVLLKKEKVESDRPVDEFETVLSMKSRDALDTEIELITTRAVLGKAIEELNLQFVIREVFIGGQTLQTLNMPYKEYTYFLSERTQDDRWPIIKELTVDYPYPTREYRIQIDDGLYRLYNETDDQVLQTVHAASIMPYLFDGVRMEVQWHPVQSGDFIRFKILSFEKVIKNLRKNITVTQVKNTNIFRLSVRSTNPQMAQILANTIAEKYRLTRLAQKQQTVHYTFEFVDNQLKNIREKLNEAEFNLSRFKSDYHLVDITENSKEILDFLSELESEKIKTDMELAEYENKVFHMKKQLSDKGYFDQTYLTPGRTDGERSPFSILLQQLSDAEIRRLELLQKRKSSHPDVVTIDEQITQIKSKLSEYNQNTLISYQIIINSLQKKKYSLKKLIDKYSVKIKNLPDKESKLINLTRAKNVYEKMFTMLLDKREELRMAELSKLQDIVVVDPGRLPIEPVAPRKILNLIIGFLLGSIIGLTLIFVWDYADNKIKDVGDLENNFDFPILAIFPQYGNDVKEKIDNADTVNERLVSLMEEQSVFLESYRLLRTRLLQAKQKDNAFLFTSGEEDTGKTTIVANLGINMAKGGRKILIIDGDLKKAGISRFFDIPKSFPSIKDFLMNENSLPILFNPFKDTETQLHLRILSAGSGNVENSSELLELPKLKEFLHLARNNYDFILIDTPPVTRIIDTLVLGNLVKEVLMIVKPRHTIKDGLKFAIEELVHADLNIIGFVLNACNLNSSPHRYKYGYGYGYYKKENELHLQQ